ncbi:hypothetical protein JZ785_22580 [Alicyclobacillus curvatus]|nr:hypothetical protein JZ785_22580 [Alicyclobacillus curvatus]
MEFSLSSQSWFVKGYFPYVPLNGKSMETGKDLKGLTDWVPASVPGGVHYDLFRAGWIDNPYIDMNSLKAEWVENKWWMYKTAFSKQDFAQASDGNSPFVGVDTGTPKVQLIFKGLDYEAIVYLNHRRLGAHIGMYDPAVFDITDIYENTDTFELRVLFKHVPEEMGQIGYTSRTRTQKSRFNYKWDFGTRLVNIGIWDDVVLKVTHCASIEEVHTKTRVNLKVPQQSAAIETSFLVETRIAACAHSDGVVPSSTRQFTENMTFEITCTHPNGEVADTVRGLVDAGRSRQSARLTISDPALWYPNGFGEQPLYEISIRLFKDEQLCDEQTLKIGIRQLEYVQNEDALNAFPYTFVVNGHKIYIKGVNMTPLEHVYGIVTTTHYEWLVRQMKRANVNMVRIWGGGLIEKEALYDLCDQHGIMVWQEFIQSSSGIDNTPSHDPDFLELLKESSIAAIKGRRNHVSLAVWSGGNELQDGPNQPSTLDDENISMLKSLVETYDGERMFLPTSASGPVEFVTSKKNMGHDVHGHWEYLGNPEHYRVYTNSDNLFHSEFGTPGATSARNMRKFLSPVHQHPAPMTTDLVWRFHGEWWDTYGNVTELFGPQDDLTAFSDGSQWIQAEGLRFIVEANERKKFHNSGSIIWQLNEPWPNVSCTSLMDYFGDTKMAYHFISRTFAPVHVSLTYSKLNHSIGDIFAGQLFLHSSGPKRQIGVHVLVFNEHGETLYEEVFDTMTEPLRCPKVGSLEFEVTRQHAELFFIRADVKTSEGVARGDVYTFSTRTEAIYAPALQFSPGSVTVQPSNDWQQVSEIGFSNESWVRRYELKNTAQRVVLHVRAEEASDTFWMEATPNFVTLLPSETVTVEVLCQVKSAAGFLYANMTNDVNAPSELTREPNIQFRQFSEY